MLSKARLRYRVGELLTAVVLILLAAWIASGPSDLFAQQEQEEEIVPSQTPVPEPQCTFFTNFQQHSAIGVAEAQRVAGWGTTARAVSQISAQTVEVSNRLGAVLGSRPPDRQGPWISRIDFHIFSALEQQNIPPAPLSTDAEFLRRLTLDLTGRIPTAEQVQQFLADPDPQKRSRAVERLLNSPEWVDRGTMWLGDLLKNNSVSVQINRGPQGRTALYEFIKTSLAQNKPYNQFVTELLTGEGDSFVSGPANFLVGGTMSMGPAQDTYDRQWVQTATMFLGLKHFDCLLCHDGEGHLDSVNLWATQVKRSEAWGLAAFFSRTRIRRPGGQGTTYNVSEATTGGYNLNTNSGNRPSRAPSSGVSSPVLPRYLFSGRQLRANDNFRVELARELTHDLQFARATVNYIWKHFFGIGLVEPADGFDLARLDPRNPPPDPWKLQPSHPELLDELARTFVNQGFDLKELMRMICNSQAYQLSSRYPGVWEESYTRYFARHLIRRLDAEELADAVVQSSGVANNMTVAMGGGSTITVPWAMQLPETTVPGGAVGTFLNTFLRGDRDETPRSGDLSTSQALALMNDSFVINRVRGSTGNGGRIGAWINAGLDNTQLVQAIYLSTLSRYPTAEELAAAVQTFQSGTRAARAQDLLWTLYNKVDFIFNY
ncbi:MAG TPA: DUF1553 domain-containing protein [Terriglobia bacterium]|nr:DUF1553 domain-containing protein [Terriglobia bacterium]